MPRILGFNRVDKNDRDVTRQIVSPTRKISGARHLMGSMSLIKASAREGYD